MLSPSKLKLVFAISIFIGLLSIAGVVALIVIWYTKLTPFQDYSIIIDAGSTHSKIFLYTWPADKSDGLGLTSRVSQVTSCSVGGGPITSIVDPTSSNVEQYFQSAMSICTNQIPANRKSRALIFLGGTAGLRLFNISNSSYTDSLLTGTRGYFSTLGLHFKSPENQVRIISGGEEGVSGWISTNILMGQLFSNNKPFETYGVSDMGGASTQISFVSPNATYDRFNMTLFNTEYDVYSHSYLCYGTEQIRLIYLGQIVNNASGSSSFNDPCLQKGYIQNSTYDDIFSTACARNHYAPLPSLNKSSSYSFIGTGNYEQCFMDVQERLNKSGCNLTSESCSFDSVYQPKPISPALKFYAISAWYSVFNNLAPNISLSKNTDGNYDFENVTLRQIRTAIASICNQLWSDLPDPDQYRPFLCFNSMYHWTLFERGYQMTDENLQKFHIIKTINGNEIGWSLGYMINQTNYLDPEYRPGRLLTRDEFSGLLFLCLFFVVLSIIVAILSMTYFRKREDLK